MKTFLSWWCVVLAIGAVVFYTIFTGQAQRIFLDDNTHITYLIAAVGIAMSIYLGIVSYWDDSKIPYRRAKTIAALRAAAEAQNVCMMLGLLGTALGAIMLYKTKLVVGVGDVSGAASMLANMLGGLGAIFGCTAVSGASTVSLMAQSFFLKRAIGQ